MSQSSFHRLVGLGDLEGVRRMLGGAGLDINAYDRLGRSPLMVAMQSPAATPELCALLLEHGRTRGRRMRWQSADGRDLAI